MIELPGGFAFSIETLKSFKKMVEASPQVKPRRQNEHCHVRIFQWNASDLEPSTPVMKSPSQTPMEGGRFVAGSPTPQTAFDTTVLIPPCIPTSSRSTIFGGAPTHTADRGSCQNDGRSP